MKSCCSPYFTGATSYIFQSILSAPHEAKVQRASPHPGIPKGCRGKRQMQ